MALAAFLQVPYAHFPVNYLLALFATPKPFGDGLFLAANADTFSYPALISSVVSHITPLEA